ncbi:unnamed protein product [Cylicocyclus nassatus]|uniref:Uncharacterized protein n=1 Tax=Cylicocyclus nassatus TaxID=53992 RepID=A0AA36DRH4_CYLNA|nr:unnamed protein product [Cylicocyclus nassatus]
MLTRAYRRIMRILDRTQLWGVLPALLNWDFPQIFNLHYCIVVELIYSILSVFRFRRY